MHGTATKTFQAPKRWGHSTTVDKWRKIMPSKRFLAECRLNRWSRRDIFCLVVIIRHFLLHLFSSPLVFYPKPDAGASLVYQQVKILEEPKLDFNSGRMHKKVSYDYNMCLVITLPLLSCYVHFAVIKVDFINCDFHCNGLLSLFTVHTMPFCQLSYNYKLNETGEGLRLV